MAKVRISANSVLVRHGHLQYSGAFCNGGHVLQYHTCVIAEGADFKDQLRLHMTLRFVAIAVCLKDTLGK